MSGVQNIKNSHNTYELPNMKNQENNDLNIIIHTYIMHAKVTLSVCHAFNEIFHWHTLILEATLYCDIRQIRGWSRENS